VKVSKVKHILKGVDEVVPVFFTVFSRYS